MDLLGTSKDTCTSGECHVVWKNVYVQQTHQSRVHHKRCCFLLGSGSSHGLSEPQCNSNQASCNWQTAVASHMSAHQKREQVLSKARFSRLKLFTSTTTRTSSCPLYFHVSQNNSHSSHRRLSKLQGSDYSSRSSSFTLRTIQTTQNQTNQQVRARWPSNKWIFSPSEKEQQADIIKTYFPQ